MDDEKWPDEILAVTCLRVRDADLVVAGSVQKTCWRCESAIWVSPATLDHVRTRPHRFLCMACAAFFAERDQDAKLAMPTKAQLRELLQTLGGADPFPIEFKLSGGKPKKKKRKGGRGDK